MNFDPLTIKQKLNDPEQRNQALAEIGEWVKDTCLLFGASPDVAFQVTAIFLRGLKNDKL